MSTPQLTANFDVVAEMNMPDKIKLLCGRDRWPTEAIPEHGIPSMRLCDDMWEDIISIEITGC